MAKTISVDLGQAVTVSGTANLVQLDTVTSTLYMRRYLETSPGTFTYQDQTAGTNNGTGNWSFDLVDGLYQCWKSASPDTTAGNRYDKWHGGSGKYRWVGDDYLPYVKKITDGSGTYWECESLEFRSAGVTTEANSLIRKSEADLRYLTPAAALLVHYTITQIDAFLAFYLDKRSGALTQQVQSQVNFRDYAPTSSIPATALPMLTRRQDMMNYVQSILAGATVTAFQQSPNVVRVIYSGLQEPNKVYTTLAAGITNAASFADSTRPMIVLIQGNGDTDTNTVNATLLPAGTSADYVHIVGEGAGVTVRLEDSTYDCTTDSLNVYANLTMDAEADTAVPAFDGKIFHDVNFINSFGGTQSFSFTDCTFSGICRISTSGTSTFTNCKGMLLDTVNNKFILLSGIKTGAFDIITSGGDVRPKRIIGRQAVDITAASTITIGDGNFAVVNGNTNITTISITGFENGSIIHLLFTGTPTINVSGAGNVNAPANIVCAANDVHSFILYSTEWYRIL